MRDRVIGTLLDTVPLTTEEDRSQLGGAVRDALGSAGRLGPVSVLLLIAAGSGVMSALRHAINQAWDIQARPPLLLRKALDVVLVLGATVVLLLSLSLTATRRAEAYFSEEERDGWLLGLFFDAVGDLLPFLFVTAVILGLYRLLPMRRSPIREIWPGAVVATAGLAVVKGGLELYFEHLADFGALYGSLGALMALLLFVFAASNVLVFGAEFASEWSRLPPGHEVDRIVRDGRRRVRLRFRRPRDHREGP